MPGGESAGGTPLSGFTKNLLMNKYLQSFVLLLLSGFFALPGRGQVAPGEISSELMSESIEAVLGKGVTVQWIQQPLADEVRTSFKEQLRIKSVSSLPDTLYIGKARTDDGYRYLIPDIAPSRSEHYSYILYLKPDKSIADVDVLKYRENYGYEIDYPFFREQFHGKKDPDELQFGRSIQNISGATISARSLTYSVHDLLTIIQQISLQ